MAAPTMLNLAARILGVLCGWHVRRFVLWQGFIMHTNLAGNQSHLNKLHQHDEVT